MSHLSRPALSLTAAGLVLALSGCAMMEGSTTTTTTAQATAPTTMGSGSWFMRAGLDAFSLSNCMKYEATPRECESVLPGTGQ